MRQRIIIICLIIISFSNYCIAEKIDTSIVQLARLEPEEIIYRERVYLKKIIENYLNIYLEEDKANTVEKKMIRILDTLTSSRGIKYSEWYGKLTSFGTHLPNTTGVVVLINDPVIYAILVASLTSPAIGADNEVFNMLEFYSRKDYIRAFSKYIKAGFQKIGRISPYIYPFCDLTTEERKEFLQSKRRLPLYLKAAAGDLAAEDSVLKMFNSAETFEKKRPFIEELGFIGTNKCIVKLLNELDKIHIFEESNKTSSYQMEILFAIARNFPDEPLFYKDTYYMNRICYTGDQLKDYLKRVTEWVFTNYNIKLENLNKMDFLCKYDMRGRYIHPPTEE